MHAAISLHRHAEEPYDQHYQRGGEDGEIAVKTIRQEGDCAAKEEWQRLRHRQKGEKLSISASWRPTPSDRSDMIHREKDDEDDEMNVRQP